MLHRFFSSLLSKVASLFFCSEASETKREFADARRRIRESEPGSEERAKAKEDLSWLRQEHCEGE